MEVATDPQRHTATSPQAVLDELVASGTASCAVGYVATGSGLVWWGGAGRMREHRGAPPELATRFDLASLTKPFTATLALVLDASGELPLALRIGEIWPATDARLGRRTLESLLRHRSGLAAWAPLESLCRNPAGVLDRLTSGRFLGASAPTYSDLGYILWTLAAEERLGRAYARLVRARVLGPLGLAAVAPSPGPGRDVAESLLDRTRESELAARMHLRLTQPIAAPAAGTVQDGNARFLGGISGHAGLFANAESVAALAREWLHPGRLLAPPAVERALGGPVGAYALGWARRRVRGSAGAALSPDAFGHTGSTGTSVWIDPAADLIVVLLAYRRSARADMNAWRRRLHVAALAARSA